MNHALPLASATVPTITIERQHPFARVLTLAIRSPRTPRAYAREAGTPKQALELRLSLAALVQPRDNSSRRPANDQARSIDPLWPFRFRGATSTLQRKRSDAARLTGIYGQTRFRRNAVP